MHPFQLDSPAARCLGRCFGCCLGAPQRAYGPMAAPAPTPRVRQLDFQLCIDACTAAPSERAALPRRCLRRTAVGECGHLYRRPAPWCGAASPRVAAPSLGPSWATRRAAPHARRGLAPVSYTHLRAHETSAHL
eukprot:10396815-Alexandrium_andersonii.AAC.1